MIKSKHARSKHANQSKDHKDSTIERLFNNEYEKNEVNEMKYMMI